MKKYIKPACEVNNIQMDCDMLRTSPALYHEEEGDLDIWLSKQRETTWGNTWENDWENND